MYIFENYKGICYLKVIHVIDQYIAVRHINIFEMEDGEQ